ncbi:MFS general substrate transporter [Coprinellus micaceus]|uniref:MFS general substrate transporter n=1 Tax=Coprinellus micaceus TaxID=71717 RepID=A0A4Y7SZS2_COPMI|nr:MFS general substrate transporter [Coprinellus micaceus]
MPSSESGSASASASVQQASAPPETETVAVIVNRTPSNVDKSLPSLPRSLPALDPLALPPALSLDVQATTTSGSSIAKDPLTPLSHSPPPHVGHLGNEKLEGNEKAEGNEKVEDPNTKQDPTTKDANHPTTFVETTLDFGFLPIPPHLRYHPARPFRFGLGLNVAFGFASTFIVANLYYNQPLLIQLSHAFGVPYTRVSAVPALTQAGYAAGLLFISPMGDLVPRRPLILLTIALSALLTTGLCVARDVRVFEGVSFAVGVCTVTPQILIPLAADLAPPERRASAISVVLSGLLLGILIARVLSGVIAEYTSWRVVYYFALSVQSLVLLGAYLLLPSYPAKNTGGGAGGERMTYGKILKSMAHFAYTEPVLVQCTLVNLASAAAFANFWVTLTFLLGGDPYNYSTLVIGLFGLVGMAGVAFGPVVGYVIDRLVPWYASLAAVLGYLLFQTIYTAAGTKSVAVVVIACFGLDVFRQMLQVSLTTAAFSISTAARARLNAILILGIFIGQVTGTALGTHLFLNYGFLPNAGLNLGLMGFQLFLLGVRGPGLGRYGWFGWARTRAGWEWRRSRALNLMNGEGDGPVHRPPSADVLEKKGESRKSSIQMQPPSGQLSATDSHPGRLARGDPTEKEKGGVDVGVVGAGVPGLK